MKRCTVSMVGQLNHTVLGNPNTTFTNGNFGKILGTQTAPRVGEMGLKLLF
jgi:hypothetical protein